MHQQILFLFSYLNIFTLLIVFYLQVKGDDKCKECTEKAKNAAAEVVEKAGEILEEGGKFKFNLIEFLILFNKGVKWKRNLPLQVDVKKLFITTKSYLLRIRLIIENFIRSLFYKV